MSRLDLASLREGDVIESHQTLQVVSTGKCGYIEARDVQSDRLYGFTAQQVDGSLSTLKLTMVKRAVRKPKVGDVITGADIKATQWKVGTVVVSEHNPRDVYVLNTDGTWSSSRSKWTIRFRDFGDDYKCKLLHVA